MLEKLNLWVQSITVAVAITTLIEMILPEGSSRKYVKIICGLYLLFTIISPITDIEKIDLSNINFDLEDTIEVSNADEKSILDLYIQEYEKDITKKLIDEGYSLDYVKIDIDSSLSEITEINIYLKNVSEEDKNELKNKIKSEYGIKNINVW